MSAPEPPTVCDLEPPTVCGPDMPAVCDLEPPAITPRGGQTSMSRPTVGPAVLNEPFFSRTGS